MITAELLKTLNPRLSHGQAQTNAAALQKAAVKFGISDPRSLAAWLANIAVESGFLAVRENMNYRDPARARNIFKALARYPDSAFAGKPVALANIVYAGRLGNGNVASGDGWRYRGGGHIQNTGRSGYRVTGKAIGLDLEGKPELIEDPQVAADAAAAYWTRLSNADQLARAGDIRGTRRAVNGPRMLHADEMLAYYGRALPLVQQSHTPQVLLVPGGGGEPVAWNGRDRYAGQDLVALVPHLRQVYPLPGGPWKYGEILQVWVRRNGDMVLERVPRDPTKDIPATPPKK